MKALRNQPGRFAVVIGAALLCISTFQARAAIEGISGMTFNLTASSGYIDTPDGDSLLVWGYSQAGQPMQYPGPTLIVNQGDTVTITLTSQLPMPASIVFPGHENVAATGGAAGLITQESTGPGETVTYQFNASHPGTYMYHSGTRPELQIEMGLIGAIVVRPSGFSATNRTAYGHPDTAYDHEYLFLLTEMDPKIHYLVDAGNIDQVDDTAYDPVLWFINGRNGPDTMGPNYAPWMPHQPYNSLPRTHPGEKLLLRVVGGGRDLHPFHTHGNNFDMIARDGRLLSSAPGAGPDLAVSDYTVKTMPGETYDGIWQWTGKKLGWDIYGTAPDFPHECVSADGDDFDDNTHEYCPDHGKPVPVGLPELQDLTFGGFYSGSPFLGAFGHLPPGEGGLNLNGGLFFMWHSHTEKELVNNDIFPGGMMTMCIVEPPGVPIP